VAEREPEPLPLDAHDDQAETGPRIELAVEQPQLGRARRELEEAEGGGEVGAACLVRHQFSRPSVRSRTASSGVTQRMNVTPQ